jgi:hypothetical protein
MLCWLCCSNGMWLTLKAVLLYLQRKLANKAPRYREQYEIKDIPPLEFIPNRHAPSMRCRFSAYANAIWHHERAVSSSESLRKSRMVLSETLKRSQSRSTIETQLRQRKFIHPTPARPSSSPMNELITARTITALSLHPFTKLKRCAFACIHERSEKPNTA